MAAVSEYIINLQGTISEPIIVDFQLDDKYFEQLEQNEIFGGEVAAKAELTPIGSRYKLRLSIEGKVKITCDRCLEQMWQAVKAEDEMLVVMGEGTDDDVVYVEKDSCLLDLSWLLYELIETNLPIVHSHQAGECNPLMEELLQSHLCTKEEPEDN